jgi:uncharacterized paraquat-inducible protein A
MMILLRTTELISRWSIMHSFSIPIFRSYIQYSCQSLLLKVTRAFLNHFPWFSIIIQILESIRSTGQQVVALQVLD